MILIFLTEAELLRRLLFAAFIGAVFGGERRHKNKPVGARTHILIALTACTVSIISAYGFTELTSAYRDSRISLRTDPARLVVGMLTGIGFVGAGIIYKSPHGDIKGVTTASEVYLVAVLGIAAGLGLYRLAASAGVIAFVALACSESASEFFLSDLLHPIQALRRVIKRRRLRAEAESSARAARHKAEEEDRN